MFATFFVFSVFAVSYAAHTRTAPAAAKHAATLVAAAPRAHTMCTTWHNSTGVDTPYFVWAVKAVVAFIHVRVGLECLKHVRVHQSLLRDTVQVSAIASVVFHTVLMPILILIAVGGEAPQFEAVHSILLCIGATE